MSSEHDEDLRWLRPEEGELAERLRRLEWPRPDAEVRERCWRALEQHMELTEPEPSAVDASRVYEYSRQKGPLTTGVLTQRLRIGRGLCRPRRDLVALALR